MKEKDYNSIYEKLYKKYLEKYIKETESLYLKIKKEGDAENYAYNACISSLTKKRNGLKILTHPYDKLYSIFNDRASLVQENDLNRLYIKHIIPRCEELNIEIKSGGFDKIIEEFAISEASKQVTSWFSNWSVIYKMMFELNDFSEFKIIRNCNFHEKSEIFIKYHKILYKTESNESPSININFKIRDKFRVVIKNLYDNFKEDFINSERTSKDDFINVFYKNSNEHNSEIHFFCKTQEIALLLRKIEFAFENLSFTTIGKSKKLFSDGNKPLTRTNLSNSLSIYKYENLRFSNDPNLRDSIERVEYLVGKIN